VQSYSQYLPLKSLNIINNWIDDLSIEIIVVKKRTTKLGDFRVKGQRLFITINEDLNKFSFLITLIHELSHAFVYVQYKKFIKPHGIEWKNMFKSKMHQFIALNIFPDDILQALEMHMLMPAASSCNDVNLSLALSKYDAIKQIFLSKIREGEYFIYGKDRVFIKQEKLRKRFKCQELLTKKIYLFNPLAPVKLFT